MRKANTLLQVRRTITALAVFSLAVLLGLSAILSAQQSQSVPRANRPLVASQIALQHFSGCLPAHGVPTHLVIETMAGQTFIMSFDKAWAINHDSNAANDIWVRLQCR